MARNLFGNLFAQSPFSPIQDHIVKAQECAEQLIPFIEASTNNDWELATTIQQTISDLESDADQIKKDIRLHLPKSLWLPVNRSDLLNLITRQDKIANRAKDISGLMLGRKIVIPNAIAAMMLEFSKTAIATSAQAVRAIQEMDELVEAGFRGNVLDLVQGLITELDDLENENDRLQVQVRAELFKIEDQLPPIEAMFLYQVIEWIGDLADRAQKVGSLMQLLISK
ncbi:TIGR00153 family protein [bacterium]|jgi:predicted phosphate transport protein (TIGR00153 family)|nr:TIGR00153 family protein [bacterium]MDB4090299.1 TIGR00153 family protein [Pseudomonadales bacterium]